MPFGKRTAPAPATNTDRRRAIRRAAAEKALLAFDRGATLIDCTIVDSSAIGAKVRFTAGRKIPDSVYLVRLTQKVAHEARVVWERDEFIGLNFIRDHDLRRPSTLELEALRQACNAD